MTALHHVAHVCSRPDSTADLGRVLSSAPVLVLLSTAESGLCVGGLTPLQAPHPPEGSPWLVLTVEAEVYGEALEHTCLPMCSAAGASHRVTVGQPRVRGGH